jgi:recombinational DNA repair protein RecR
VVEQVPDLAAIEQTHEYQGVYHVLRGLVDAGDETSLDKMKIKELFQRVKAGNHGTAIQELFTVSINSFSASINSVTSFFPDFNQ